jgi:hypothetical protein
MRLQRRVTAAEKAYKEAMDQLSRLQESTQPQLTTDQTEQLGSFLPPPSPPLDDFAIARLQLDLRPPSPLPDAG